MMRTEFVDTEKSQQRSISSLYIFLLFVFIIGLIYFNTLDASWHFDDEPNILNNRGLHIHNLKPESLVRTFFTSPTAGGSISDSLYRPIPCLTFAINWYFGKGDVFGYHLVNIAVHILTAYLVYLTILNLLKAPNLQDRYERRAGAVAFLAAALWAIHPIQTQAVTYIVQRMASMAAMFYILGIYFYIKTRQSRISAQRIGLLCGCAISFIFAIGSKENAATLPFALLLIEIIGFQDLNRPGVRKAFWVGSIVGGLLLVALSVWLFLPGGSETLISGYDERPFSLFERLLTEPRIVLFYLSLIFYPNPNRLSIEHDIQVSTSLIEPWTTLPAIFLTIILLAIGGTQIKKRPLLALAILFFYLNHVVESTFIPLELIFEHRNYLPSLFLFLPVAAGFHRLLDYYEEKNRAFRSVLIAFLVLLMIGIGAGSYIRNMAWATEKTLWEDAMQKAPNSHRPLHNLALYHYQRIGQLDKALELYRKSLELRTNNNFANPSARSNMALIYVRQNEYEKAIALWEKILANERVYGVHQYLYVIGSIEMKDWNRALTGINRLIEERPTDFNYNYLKGYVLLNLKDYHQALRYFERCLKLIADNHQALVGAGVCYSLLGQYQSAEDIFKTAHQYYPDNDLVLLWLVDTKLKQNERRAADRYLSRLLEITPVEELLESLEKNNTKHFLPPDSKTFILNMVKSAKDKKLDNIAG